MINDEYNENRETDVIKCTMIDIINSNYALSWGTNDDDKYDLKKRYNRCVYYFSSHNSIWFHPISFISHPY